MTPVVASRHIHNIAMSTDDVIYKLTAPTIDEMRWRPCDLNAPDIWPGGWYMDVRPSNELVDLRNKRGHHLPEEQRRGNDEPPAL
eukprot:6191522-Pyramimonas_sp.AAC.1